MNKEIYFCVDYIAFYGVEGVPCTSYLTTQDAIEQGVTKIKTLSLAHLSFDLLDNYDIFLCKGSKKVKIEPHMDLSGVGEPCKDLKKCHNILKIFRAGIFDRLLDE